ncbi:MAG: PP2C family protein-serine/threonine phosphatase [Selenomonadaceae bacterium]|nr:PP2C family protein-serine/threonine phosphatase [Selenomonadaceae bacterium]
MILQREAPVFSKAGLTQLTVTAAVYGILIALANHFMMTQAGFELRPGAFVPVVAGLLFGLPAAVGSFIGNFVSSHFTGYELLPNLYFSLLNFLLAYTPYRLWYGYQSHKATLYIYNNRTFLKFVLLNLLGGSSLSILASLFIRGISGITSPGMIFVTFANNFAFPLMFGLPVLLLWDKYVGTEYYRPYEEPRFWHSFARLALPALIILELASLYPLCTGQLTQQTCMTFACVGALLWFLSVQLPSEYHTHPEETDGFQTLVSSVAIRLFVGADLIVLLTLIVSTHFSGYTLAIWQNQQHWLKLCTNIIICLAVLVIGIYLVLLIMESSLTQRLKVLCARVREYLKTHDQSHLQHGLNKSTRRNELDTLEYSLQKMGEDITRYLTDLDRTIAEQEAMNTQLRIANSIQNGILPDLKSIAPQLPGYSIDGGMQPAKFIGGDAYDAFLLDSDHLIISVADVSGKGVPAALFMMITQTLLRQNAHEMPLAEAIRQTNEALVKHNEQCLFVTVWLAQLELSTGHISYINAGHNPSLLTGPEGGRCLWLDKLSGPVLGLMPDLTFTVHEANLPAGGRLLLYTDGLNEAENANHEFFGNERLERSFLSANQPQQILADIAGFVQNAEQSDDMTYLWLQRKEAAHEAAE